MNWSKPLVSVCVQTYQHVNYIRECLDSILMQQTNFPFEIILGEDASTDGTREICIEYAEKYPEIIRLYLRSREDVIYINGKATGRFNFIENLKAAKGKYIALCEGDDYWTDPHKLQKQVNFLEANPEYSMCHHSVIERFQDNDREKKVEVKQIYNENIAYQLAEKNFIYTCTVMFRRNSLSLPDWLLRVNAGDKALWLLISEKGKVKCMDEFMSVYRKHSTSYWSSQHFSVIHKKTLQDIEVLNEVFDFRYSKQFKRYNRNLYYDSLFKLRYSTETYIFFKHLLLSAIFLPFQSRYKVSDLFNHLKGFIKIRLSS